MANGLNLAELQKIYEAEKAAETSGGSNYLDNFVMMPKENGVVVVRILLTDPDLPLLKGGLCQPNRIHPINNRNAHCRREYHPGQKYPWQGDCRICDHVNWCYRQKDLLKAKGDKEGADNAERQAKAIKAYERFYFNVIVRKVVKENGEVQKDVGPLILSVGKTVKDLIFRAILGDNSIPDYPVAPLGDITDPLRGRDLMIVKKKKGGGDDYAGYDDSKFTDVCPLGTPDQIAKWMGSLHDLAALRNVKSSEEIEREVRIHTGAEKDTTKVNAYQPVFGNEAPHSPASEAVGNNSYASEPDVYAPSSRTTTVEPSVSMNTEEFESFLKQI